MIFLSRNESSPRRAYFPRGYQPSNTTLPTFVRVDDENKVGT